MAVVDIRSFGCTHVRYYTRLNRIQVLLIISFFFLGGKPMSVPSLRSIPRSKTDLHSFMNIIHVKRMVKVSLGGAQMIRLMRRGGTSSLKVRTRFFFWLYKILNITQPWKLILLWSLLVFFSTFNIWFFFWLQTYRRSTHCRAKDLSWLGHVLVTALQPEYVIWGVALFPLRLPTAFLGLVPCSHESQTWVLYQVIVRYLAIPRLLVAFQLTIVFDF